MTAKIFSSFIATTPRGKGRPRIVTRKIKGVMRPIAFTPDQTVDAESRIQTQVSGEWQRPPTESPLRVQITVRLVKPKSKPKTKPCWPTSKPDADNYAKLVLDALNGILWRDDSQVVQLFVEKAWTTPDHPHQGYALTVHALDQDLEVI